MAELFDVVVFEKATRVVDTVVGVAMRRYDGTGSGRNTAETREQTVRARINERYDVAILPTGLVAKGDRLIEEPYDRRAS